MKEHQPKIYNIAPSAILKYSSILQLHCLAHSSIRSQELHMNAYMCSRSSAVGVSMRHPRGAYRGVTLVKDAKSLQ